MTDQNESQESPTNQESPAAGNLPEIMHAAEAKGYLGTVPDETPNEAYTLTGVSQGQTPESDPAITAQQAGGGNYDSMIDRHDASAPKTNAEPSGSPEGSETQGEGQNDNSGQQEQPQGNPEGQS